MPSPSKVFGYEVRSPYQSEEEFFKRSPHVTGMAAEDGKIVLNPFSTLDDNARLSVARNEAARLFMREKGFQFDFTPDTHQRKAFAGTEYDGNDHALNSTILARAIAGDPSSGKLNQRQQEWVDWLIPQLKERD